MIFGQKEGFVYVLRDFLNDVIPLVLSAIKCRRRLFGNFRLRADTREELVALIRLSAFAIKIAIEM
jgi:hypothetical protein